VAKDHVREPPAGRSKLATAAIAISTAVIIAIPWLIEGFVWLEWIGVAVPLLLIDRIRGWRGEAWVLAGATLALALAFHWAPKVLAYAMGTEESIGLLFTAPIILWDAVRLSIPFWFAARVTRDPLASWGPAALAAVAIEGFMPAVFPWKLGYSQIAWPQLIQSADLFGPEAPTLVLYAHAGVIVWAVAMLTSRSGSRGSRHGLAALLLCVANAVYGFAAIVIWTRVTDEAPRLRVAVAQANPEREGGVDELRALTRRAWEDEAGLPDLVCWPECSGGSYDAALDSLADEDRVVTLSREPNRGMRPLEELKSPLLFGGKIYTGHPEKPQSLHQSAILIDASHAILGRYHKRHLMPFGEYVPGSDIYPDLKLYFPMQDEMTEGSEPTVLRCGPLARLGVMLCYEDMIPAAARSLTASSANVLVSLINGSAFTEPLTLRQHRMLAQLRAVECRRAFVRCAATGESCVISPVGVVTNRLPLGTPGILVADVPLLQSRTAAYWLQHCFPVAAAIAVIGMVLFHRRTDRANRRSGNL
jgi:apolipoprotein N-acyltransferase